ncbi:MAG: 3-oxoacyl-[acyl-carrier-protein] reductase [Candidatus Omnitrophota bacterium]|nr:MAG: 3-oxoacyl-[acyl-carrier-protein] reductase [Candidatus Omnitrophota bacterium]
MLLKDKVAIITGSARGIGKEIALTFAREGARVVCVDINLDILAETEKEISALGAQVLSIACDVTKSNDVEQVVNKTLDKFKKIDILISNAGITADTLLVRMKEEDWDRVLAVNLKGTFNCIKAASKVMMKQRGGSILSTASVIGLIGNVGQANYAASKAGVIGLTKSAAKELASRGITVNAIAPGFIQTHMTDRLPEQVKSKILEKIPLQKFGTPADVAQLALFLVSEKARYITGQVICIDGGMV